MSEYTPTTAHVRELWVDTQTGGEYGYLDNGERAGAAFDRWLSGEQAFDAAVDLRIERDAAIKRAEAAEAEVERLHSWRGLLSLMDEHWPENVFPTLTDDPARDTGPRLLSALRRAEAAEAERDLLEAERDQALAELGRRK